MEVSIVHLWIDSEGIEKIEICSPKIFYWTFSSDFNWQFFIDYKKFIEELNFWMTKRTRTEFFALAEIDAGLELMMCELNRPKLPAK